MNRAKVDSVITRVLGVLVAVIFILLPFHAVLTTLIGSNFGHLDFWRIWKELLIVLMAPFAAYLAFSDANLRNWLLSSWMVRIYLLYVILSFGLGSWAYHDHQVNSTALIYALLINLRFIGFFIIAYIVTVSSPWLKKKWKELLLLPGGLVVVFGLMQRFFLPYDFLKHFGYSSKTIPAYQTVDATIDYRRLQSTLRGANPLGAYLVLIIPAIFVAFKKKPWTQIFSAAAAGLIMFFSYSRSAWVGLALALGFLAYNIANANLRKIVMIVGGLALAVLIVLAVSLRNDTKLQDTLFHTSSSSKSSQSSNAARSHAEKTGLSNVLHQLQGRGPGTAGPASVRNNHPARIAENYYIQIAQEVGVVGLLMFLAINYLVVKELWHKRKNDLARILIASWVGISFINLVSHEWTDDTLSLLWWGLAGVALAPAILKLKNKGNEKIHPKTS